MKGWEIVAMATILVDSDDSMMFQMDSSWVSGHQSQAMGVPWMPIVGHGEQEQEVRELEGGLRSGESCTDQCIFYLNICIHCFL